MMLILELFVLFNLEPESIGKSLDLLMHDLSFLMFSFEYLIKSLKLLGKKDSLIFEFHDSLIGIL